MSTAAATAASAPFASPLSTMHEVRDGIANCKKLKACVDMVTVGEGTENVQRILIAEDALGLNDPNRHPVRNRARG